MSYATCSRLVHFTLFEVTIAHCISLLENSIIDVRYTVKWNDLIIIVSYIREIRI